MSKYQIETLDDGWYRLPQQMEWRRFHEENTYRIVQSDGRYYICFSDGEISRDYVLLSDAMDAVEAIIDPAADKPDWIDLPSGLAAACVWRGFMLSANAFRWMAVSEKECDGRHIVRNAVSIEAAKSAAEAWLREQTGKEQAK